MPRASIRVGCGAGFSGDRIDPERFPAVLPACMRNGVRIATNMGAANPLGAARAVRREAQALGLQDVPVAVVLGDDVTAATRANPQPKALNFVIENALGGAVTISLAQDAHGKSLSYLMLDIELPG